MPGEDIYSWSATAANNDDADTSINWREGQTRASVNDSSRSLMAAVAKFRDLLKGTIVTGGTANAQTFTSGVSYTTVPTGLRALLKIGPLLTNTTTTTLSMDGITAAPVKNKAGADLIGGELVAGGYVEVIYDGTNWVLAADGKEKVNRSGDTMTGALTTPTLTVSGMTTLGAMTVSGTITSSDIIYAVAFGLPATGGLFGFDGGGEGAYLRWQADGWRIQFTSASGAMWYVTSAGARPFFFGPTGDFTITGNGFKPGGGVWADSSDARIKNVLGDYSSGLAAVKSLQPVRYTFKGNDPSHEGQNGKQFIGLVAQDVEAQLPELVTQVRGHIDGEGVDDLRMLDSSALTFALVNCVKELLQRIEALEAKG